MKRLRFDCLNILFPFISILVVVRQSNAVARKDKRYVSSNFLVLSHTRSRPIQENRMMGFPFGVNRQVVFSYLFFSLSLFPYLLSQNHFNDD